MQITKGRKDLRGHLVDFTVREPQVTAGVVSKVLTVKELHQGVEQTLGSLVVIYELDNVVVVDVLQSIKFIEGAFHGNIPVKYLNRVELVLNQVFCFENFPKSTFTKLFVQNQRLRNTHSRFHVFEIQLSLNRGRFIAFLF